MTGPIPTPTGTPSRKQGPLASLIRMSVTLLIAIPIVAAGVLFIIQDKMIYYARGYDNRIGEMLRGTGAQTVEFRSGDEGQVCYWVPGKDPGPESPIWFLFGGNASRGFDWIDLIEPMQRAHPDWSYVLVEYPGYGHSGGGPGRNAIGRVSADLRAEVRKLTGLDSEQMGARTCVLGHSMGAAAGVEFASSHGASVVVMISPFTNLLEMAKRSVGPVYAQLLRDRWDNEAGLVALQNSPRKPRLLMYHGGVDSIVPVEMSRSLAKAHPGWVEYEELAGFDHNDVLREAIGRVLAVWEPIGVGENRAGLEEGKGNP